MTIAANILNALETIKPNGQKVVMEVQQHLGEDRVRAISMEGTEGLTRGGEVVDLGSAIAMPTGEGIKGRLFNVVGEAIDGIEQPEDQGLVLADILMDGCVDRDKSYCIDANYHKGGNPKFVFL